jgi:hypothetical protein
MIRPGGGRRARTAILAASAVLAVVGAACGGSGSGGPSSNAAPSARPSSTATISFISPTDGEVVSGASIPVKIELTGGKVVPQTSTDIRPDEGHIHLYLDDQLVSMNYGLTATLTDVPPGTHLLRAEFVAADHVPFDPRDFTQVAFEVTP